MLQTHTRPLIKSPPARAHDAHAEQGKHDPAQVDAADNEAAAGAVCYLLLRGSVVALLLLIPFTYEPAAAASGTTGAGCWRRLFRARWRRGAAAAGAARVQHTSATCCIKQGPCCCRRGHVLLRKVLTSLVLIRVPRPLLADGHGCCLSLLLGIWRSKHSLVVVLDQDAQHEHEKGPKQGRPRTERASCNSEPTQHLSISTWSPAAWPDESVEDWEITATAGLTPLRNAPATLHIVRLLLLLLLRYLRTPAAAGGWANATKSLLYTGTT